MLVKSARILHNFGSDSIFILYFFPPIAARYNSPKCEVIQQIKQNCGVKESDKTAFELPKFVISANRHVGATNMNEKSSRSHSIFRVIIESKEREYGDVSMSDGAVNVSHLVCYFFVI